MPELGDRCNSPLLVKNSDAADDTPSNRAAKARITLVRSRAATPSPSPPKRAFPTKVWDCLYLRTLEACLRIR
jgi:hypothetical protein